MEGTEPTRSLLFLRDVSVDAAVSPFPSWGIAVVRLHSQAGLFSVRGGYVQFCWLGTKAEATDTCDVRQRTIFR